MLVLLIFLALIFSPHLLPQGQATPPSFYYLTVATPNAVNQEVYRIPSGWAPAQVSRWLSETRGWSDSSQCHGTPEKENFLYALNRDDKGAVVCAEVEPRLPLFFDRPVPINRADAATLEMIPGIGPVLASRIVAYRDTKFRFTSPASLREVPGIGPAKAKKLSPYFSFE